MVARIWKARATEDGASRYVDYFRSHVVPDLRAVSGYQGAKVLVRPGTGGDTRIVVITWWGSFDAVRAFAGEQIEAAVVHPAAADLLTAFDRHVVHYEVGVDDSFAGRP